jgi:hypothetical protein
VVEGKGALALHIVVPVSTKMVVFADQNLRRMISLWLAVGSDRAQTTFWLPPGSLTVVSCSSLYFLNAASVDRSKLGSREVMDLMSAWSFNNGPRVSAIGNEASDRQPRLIAFVVLAMRRVHKIFIISVYLSGGGTFYECRYGSSIV